MTRLKKLKCSGSTYGLQARNCLGFFFMVGVDTRVLHHGHDPDSLTARLTRRSRCIISTQPQRPLLGPSFVSAATPATNPLPGLNSRVMLGGFSLQLQGSSASARDLPSRSLNSSDDIVTGSPCGYTVAIGGDRR
jgi:hypothetical protein